MNLSNYKYATDGNIIFMTILGYLEIYLNNILPSNSIKAVVHIKRILNVRDI